MHAYAQRTTHPRLSGTVLSFFLIFLRCFFDSRYEIEVQVVFFFFIGSYYVWIGMDIGFLHFLFPRLDRPRSWGLSAFFTAYDACAFVSSFLCL